MKNMSGKKVLFWMVALLLACLIAGSAASAQRWIDENGTTTTENYVTVSGVVTDADGNPIPKAWVNLKAEKCEMNMMFLDFVPCHGYSETDENGRFAIDALQGYGYDIYIDGYQAGFMGGFFRDADAADNAWAGRTTNDWAARTLMNIGAEGISGIKITLNSGKKIFGKAIDYDGTPVQGVWIEAQAVDENTPMMSRWAGASTDEYGNFSITVFPDSTYRLSSWFWEKGYIGGYWKAGEDNSLTSSGQDGTLVLDRETSTILNSANDNEVNIIFAKGTTLSGTVTDEDGNAISGVWVETYAESNDVTCADKLPINGLPQEDYRCMPIPYAYGAATNEDGYYEIGVYPTSGYRVGIVGNGMYNTVYYNNATTLADATLIDASQNSVTEINFVLKMNAVNIGGTVSGLREGVKAFIETWSFTTGNWGSTTIVGTAEEGTPFEIRGLQEGEDYAIRIWADGYIHGCVMQDGSVEPCFNADGSDPMGGTDQAIAYFKTGTTDIKIVLNSGRAISGTLSGVSEGDVIHISAYSDSTWSKDGIRIVAAGETAAYTLSGLSAASDYKVWVYAEGYLAGYYGGKGLEPVAWDKAVPVSTKEGDAVGIDITMSTGKTISGTVKGLDADAVAVISAVSDSIGSYGEVTVVGTTTGADVLYKITCLGAAADFKVSIWAKKYIGGFYSTEGITDWANATPVNSSENPTKIDFAISKGHTISGIITGLAKGDWATIEAYQKDIHIMDPATDPGIMKPECIADSSGVFIDCRPNWGGKNWGETVVEGTGEPVGYTISGLGAATDFTVVFRAFGYAPQVKTGVDSSTNPTDIHFTASEGNRISGTITGLMPDQWVSINVWSRETGDIGNVDVTTDQNGSADYEIKGLGNASDYVVSAWTQAQNLFYNQKFSMEEADRVNLSGGSAETIDFRFDAIQNYTLAGTIAGVNDDTQVIIDVWGETVNAWNCVKQTGNGPFEMKLPAGSYKIGIYAEGVNVYYDAATGTLTDNWMNANALALTSDVNVGTLTLFVGYTISGKLLNAASEPVIGVSIKIIGENAGGTAVSKRNGEYRIAGLRNGKYDISVWSSQGNYNGTVTIDGNNVHLDLSLTSSEKASVQEMAPSLTTDNALKVGKKMVLILFDDAGKFVNMMKTDEEGNYPMGELAPGKYTIKTEKEDGMLEVVDTLTVNP